MQLDTLNDERKLNRISFQRWENSIERGYDPVTNTKLPSSSLIPLSKRPVTVWDKVQTTLPANEVWNNTIDRNGGTGHINSTLNRSQTAASTTKLDVSNNHGLNDDWDNEYQEKKSNNNNNNNNSRHKELNLSKSLSHLPTAESLTERNGMKNSQSITNLKISSSRNSKEKPSVPSLDFTKTSSGSGVRTGGLGSINN